MIALFGALRFGLPVRSVHRCMCTAQADAQGHHALSCKKRGWKIVHLGINAIIKSAFTSAGIECKVELKGISRSDGKGPRLNVVSVGQGTLFNLGCVVCLSVAVSAM